MPKGLKKTSSLIVIGASVAESAPSTLTTAQINLQLNALDNEVFVIESVDIEGSFPEQNPGAITGNNIWLTKQDPLGVTPRFEQSNVVATKVLAQDGRGGINFTVYETGSMEAPPTTMEYLNIIATPDFFLSVEGANNAAGMSAAVKVYGYRAVADAATFAALVQSEVLSQ